MAVEQGASLYYATYHCIEILTSMCTINLSEFQKSSIIFKVFNNLYSIMNFDPDAKLKVEVRSDETLT